MQRILVERARGALRQQAGFTLVELLVTVGIIVALAAVIVPSVVIFSGKGDTGAKAAETDNVQVAMDTMMADTGIFSVTALGSGDLSSKTWTALPAGVGAAPPQRVPEGRSDRLHLLLGQHWKDH